MMKKLEVRENIALQQDSENYMDEESLKENESYETAETRGSKMREEFLENLIFTQHIESKRRLGPQTGRVCVSGWESKGLTKVEKKLWSCGIGAYGDT